jgi:hypothetical protein
MKPHHVALLVWLALGVALNAYVRASTARLPDRIAVHFNARGQADGWMTGAQAENFIIGFGIGVSALIMVSGAGVRLVPARAINIPKRDYWLAPEHRPEANEYLRQIFSWAACAMMLFSLGLQFVLVEANHRDPPELSNPHMLLLVIGLALIIVGLMIRMNRQFARGG